MLISTIFCTWIEKESKLCWHCGIIPPWLEKNLNISPFKCLEMLPREEFVTFSNSKYIFHELNLQISFSSQKLSSPDRKSQFPKGLGRNDTMEILFNELSKNSYTAQKMHLIVLYNYEKNSLEALQKITKSHYLILILHYLGIKSTLLGLINGRSEL